MRGGKNEVRKEGRERRNKEANKGGRLSGWSLINPVSKW